MNLEKTNKYASGRSVSAIALHRGNSAPMFLDGPIDGIAWD